MVHAVEKKSILSALSNPLVRVLLPSIGAFLIHGAWAFWANRHFAFEVSLNAGLAQGAGSLVGTLVVSAAMEYLFVRMAGVPWHLFWVVVLPTAGVAGLTVLGHQVVGTPNIFLSVGPSVVFGFVFGIAYVWNLDRVA